MVTTEEIEKLAALSRISLAPEEKEKMRGEFDSILEYVSALKKISAEGSANIGSVVVAVNVMRSYVNPHESGMHTEELLKAAPRRQGSYVKVKKIL